MKTVYAIGEYIIDFLGDQSYNFKAQPGGAPANVAACVSLLGGQASLISSLGNDMFKDYLINIIKKVNVDSRHISIVDKKNMLAFISLNKDKDRTFDFFQTDTANLYLDLPYISKINFKDDILHFCTVSLQNENNIKAHIEAINSIKSNKGIVSLDPNLRFNLWEDNNELKSVTLNFLKFANILKLSSEELYYLTDIKNEKDAVEKLWHDDLVVLWVTKGKDGATLYTKEKHVDVSGVKVSVVDTTGAGDAFIGSVLYKIQQINLDLSKIPFETWVEITKFANEKAAISTTFNGAISAYEKAFK